MATWEAENHFVRRSGIEGIFSTNEKMTEIKSKYRRRGGMGKSWKAGAREALAEGQRSYRRADGNIEAFLLSKLASTRQA